MVFTVHCTFWGSFGYYLFAGTTRDFQLAEDAFLKADGFLLLSQAMQAENEKLVTKSAFMLLNMLTTNPSHKGINFIKTSTGYRN